MKTTTILDLRPLPGLRAELETARDAYRSQRSVLRGTPSGKAKGMAGYKLSLIGKAGREVAMKVAELEGEALLRGVLV